MPVPRLRSCCCGCYLRTGTLIILTYSLMGIVILFGFELYFQIKFDEISALSVFIYIIVIGSHILGVIGVITKIYLLLLPFVILQWVYLVLLIVLVVMFAINKDELYYEVIGFIVLMLVRLKYPEYVEELKKPIPERGPTIKPPLTDKEIRKQTLEEIRKKPKENPLSFDFDKQKSTIFIGAGVLVAISFFLNLYFALVALSCLLEMREEELWVPGRRKKTEWDYDYDYD